MYRGYDHDTFFLKATKTKAIESNRVKFFDPLKSNTLTFVILYSYVQVLISYETR